MMNSNKLFIHIPRLKLTGGNLVSLALAQHLDNEGYQIRVFTGVYTIKPENIELKIAKRGVFNSLKNCVCFISCSIFSLLNINTIATHHLTVLFNFLRPTKYCFVQDLESKFYPKSLQFFGGIFWKNYLRSEKKIYTNRLLADKCGDELLSIGFSFKRKNSGRKLYSRNIDVMLILRDGDYKNHDLTIDVHKKLLNNGIKSLLINATRKSLVPESSLSTVSQSKLLELFCQSKIFLCLSKWEGLGLPNIESYLSGCQIISTEIPSAVILNSLDPTSVVLLHDYNKDNMFKKIEVTLSNNYFCNERDLVGRELVVDSLSSQWWSYIDQVFQIEGKV
ncbi:MAG: hypothetical protein ACJASR_001147 [Psychroserpens sp.]|jgi:hypothetical protein